MDLLVLGGAKEAHMTSCRCADYVICGEKELVVITSCEVEKRLKKCGGLSGNLRKSRVFFQESSGSNTIYSFDNNVPVRRPFCMFFSLLSAKHKQARPLLCAVPVPHLQYTPRKTSIVVILLKQESHG